MGMCEQLAGNAARRTSPTCFAKSFFIHNKPKGTPGAAVPPANEDQKNGSDQRHQIYNTYCDMLRFNYPRSANADTQIATKAKISPVESFPRTVQRQPTPVSVSHGHMSGWPYRTAVWIIGGITLVCIPALSVRHLIFLATLSVVSLVSRPFPSLLFSPRRNERGVDEGCGTCANSSPCFTQYCCTRKGCGISRPDCEYALMFTIRNRKGASTCAHPTPLKGFPLGHFVVAPVPRDVVEHASVPGEKGAACPEEDRDAHVSRLHFDRTARGRPRSDCSNRKRGRGWGRGTRSTSFCCGRRGKRQGLRDVLRIFCTSYSS